MPRARAWLLLTLFLGAGTSLPGLDALLFHGRVDPLAGQSHVDAAGGCADHADSCTLGRTPPGSRSATPLVTVLRFASPIRPSSRRPPAAPALEPRATFLPQPRAPPAPLV